MLGNRLFANWRYKSPPEAQGKGYIRYITTFLRHPRPPERRIQKVTSPSESTRPRSTLSFEHAAWTWHPGPGTVLLVMNTDILVCTSSHICPVSFTLIAKQTPHKYEMFILSGIPDKESVPPCLIKGIIIMCYPLWPHCHFQWFLHSRVFFVRHKHSC